MKPWLSTKVGAVGMLKCPKNALKNDSRFGLAQMLKQVTGVLFRCMMVCQSIQ
uniref:Uncharacterized protein n=1 Tax=Amphimedon queenslandica TaxID=400682 RepID=A0A1X7U9A5_AMPQE